MAQKKKKPLSDENAAIQKSGETFKFRPGPKIGIDPRAVASELKRLWIANGERLTPPDVVTASRPDKAPLHPAFEWRDPVAAEQWRLFQARNLMRSVVVKNGDREQPLFVHVTVQREHFYQNTQVIVERPDEYAAAKAEARKKLLDVERAYRVLVELADTGERTDEEKQKIQLIWESLKTAHSVAQTLQ